MVEKLLLCLGKRKKFQVEGDSMTPLLHSGDQILVKPVKTFRIGDVVVSQHPIQSDLAIVKQVEKIEEHGRLKLIGTNKLSSSHRFGLITPDRVFGKVTSKLDEKESNR